MSKPDSNNDTISPRLNNRRVHWRTLAVVSCFVVLPWILIATPGTGIGGGGSIDMSFNHAWHGWPFVHMDRTCVVVHGELVGKKLIRGQMPPDLDLDRLAKETQPSSEEMSKECSST